MRRGDVTRRTAAHTAARTGADGTAALSGPEFPPSTVLNFVLNSTKTPACTVALLL